MTKTLSDIERRAKKNAYMKAWNARNRDKVLANKKLSNARRSAKRNAYMKEYSKQNKEQASAWRKRYRLENPDIVREQKKRSYLKHRTAIREKNKIWRENNKEILAEKGHFKYLEKMQPIPGFFYIVHFDNYTKIGTTNNWERRKSTYTHHNPLPMEIIKCEWVDNANVLEKKARWALRQYKHRGKDWFIDVPSEDVASVGSWA